MNGAHRPRRLRGLEARGTLDSPGARASGIDRRPPARARRERLRAPTARSPPSIFLALKLGKPLLLEGEAGVGKTEVAKVLAAMLGARLIRLQCYEGLDVNTAVYEWNYPRQMLQIRLLEAEGQARRRDASRIFAPSF